jgi:hypothetical protein
VKSILGADPTKLDFHNFTHICKIFLQIRLKFLTNLWKNESCQNFTNTCKPNLDFFTSILQKIGSKCLQKNFSYQTILIRSSKYVKWASYKYL